MELRSGKDEAAGATHHQEGCLVRNGANTEESGEQKCKDGALGFTLSPARPTLDLFRYISKVSFCLSQHGLSLIQHATKKKVLDDTQIMEVDQIN